MEGKAGPVVLLTFILFQPLLFCSCVTWLEALPSIPDVWCCVEDIWHGRKCTLYMLYGTPCYSTVSREGSTLCSCSVGDTWPKHLAPSYPELLILRIFICYLAVFNWAIRYANLLCILWGKKLFARKKYQLLPRLVSLSWLLAKRG